MRASLLVISLHDLQSGYKIVGWGQEGKPAAKETAKPNHEKGPRKRGG